MAKMGERILILGASRGLGKALALRLMAQDPQRMFLLMSREISQSEYLKKIEISQNQIKTFDCDFTDPLSLKKVYEQLILFRPHQFFYIAGGGPYGAFPKKAWKDHEWALRLNFLFPAELLHMMAKDWQRFHELRQLIFVGSAIAESKPDPMAASYSAGKHALVGLLTSIQAEKSIPTDLRLFSPGYMDTDMLPPQAPPRKSGQYLPKPEEVADKLLEWAADTQLRNTNLLI